MRGAAERNKTTMNTISYDAAVADLEAHPKKRIFWRSGWAYRGAREREIVFIVVLFLSAASRTSAFPPRHRTSFSFKDLLHLVGSELDKDFLKLSEEPVAPAFVVGVEELWSVFRCDAKDCVECVREL